MKKILFILALIVFLVSPVLASTTTDIKEINLNIKDLLNKVPIKSINIDKELTSDLYYMGKNINITGPIGEDALLVSTNDINIKAPVTKDVMSISKNVITIDGNIGDDVRSIGNKMIVNSTIEGDLYFMGKTLDITKDAKIKGKLTFIGDEITINGEISNDAFITSMKLNLNNIVDGNLDLNVSKVEVGEKASITKKLNYKSENKNEQLEKIADSFDFELLNYQKHKDMIKIIFGIIYLFHFIFLLIISISFYFLFEKFFLHTALDLIKKPISSFLKGIAFFVLTPLISFLLMITIIGFPIGLFLLILWVFTIVFFEIFNISLLTGVLVKRFKIKKSIAILSIITVLSAISSYVQGFDILASFFTIGALFSRDIEIIAKLREQG